MVRLGRVAATLSGTDALTVPDIEAEWGKPRTAFNPFWTQVAAELDRLEVCRGAQIVEVVDGTPETSEANDPPATTTTTTTTTTLPALPELTVEVEYVDGTPETSQYQGGCETTLGEFTECTVAGGTVRAAWRYNPAYNPNVSVWGERWGCYTWLIHLTSSPSDRARTGAHGAKRLVLGWPPGETNARTNARFWVRHDNSVRLDGLEAGSYFLTIEHYPGRLGDMRSRLGARALTRCVGPSETVARATVVVG